MHNSSIYHEYLQDTHVQAAPGVLAVCLWLQGSGCRTVLIKFVFYSLLIPYTVQSWGSKEAYVDALRQQLLNHFLQLDPLLECYLIISIVVLILQFMIVTSFLPICFSCKYKTGGRKQSRLCDTQ